MGVADAPGEDEAATGTNGAKAPNLKSEGSSNDLINGNAGAETLDAPGAEDSTNADQVKGNDNAVPITNGTAGDAA